MRIGHLVFCLVLTIGVSSIDEIISKRANTLIATKIIPALILKRATNLKYGDLHLCACTTGIGCSGSSVGWIPELQLRLSRDERQLYANVCVTDGDCFQNAHRPPILPVFGCIDSTHRRPQTEVSEVGFHNSNSGNCKNVTTGREENYWVCCAKKHFCANETTFHLSPSGTATLSDTPIVLMLFTGCVIIVIIGAVFVLGGKLKIKSILIVPLEKLDLFHSHNKNKKNEESRDIEMNCHNNETIPIISASASEINPREGLNQAMTEEGHTQSTFLGDSTRAPDLAPESAPTPILIPTLEQDTNPAPAQITSLKQLEKAGIPKSTIKLLEVLEETDSGSGTGPARLQNITISKQITNLTSCGSGGFGNVSWGIYKGEEVAVKIFKGADEKSYNAELDVYETRMLRHQNVLRYIGSDRVDNNMIMEMWIITEYQPHGSLYDFLKERKIDMRLLFKLVKSMASGLNFLHQTNEGNTSSKKPPIAHRDLKSRNVMVKRDLTCAIGDFGLSLCLPEDRIIPPAIVERTNMVGTMRYLAPEILNRSINKTVFENFLLADIYAQSLVIWEILVHLEIDGIVAKTEVEDTIPFGQWVAREPERSDMLKIVFTDKLRPKLDPAWFNNEILSQLVQYMITCWSENPSARMTAYQGKRFLDELYREHRRIEKAKNMSTEGSVEGKEENLKENDEGNDDDDRKPNKLKETEKIPLKMVVPQDFLFDDEELVENENGSYAGPDDAKKSLLD